MYSIFNITPGVSFGVMRHSKWMYLEPALKRNVDQVISYYRRSPFAVKSNHLLVRLLHAITTPKTQELLRYYDNVDASCLNIAQTLGFTSPISRGNLWNGVFYGKGNVEIIIADDSSFDPIVADKNWENLEPIRVLRHPRSDLNMNIPNGINSGVEEGIAVISVNIPMLAIQYRAFRREENRHAFMSGANERSIMQFLHMYPLTNMVRSHMDVVMFNRVDRIVHGLPFGEAKIKHPFFLIDYSKELNLFHRLTIESLEDTAKGFYDTLRTIPAVTKENLVEVMELPDVAGTRQIVWALVLARLPALNFLFRMAKGGPSTKNGMEVNMVKRRLLQLRTENLLQSVFARYPSILMDVEMELKDLMEHA